MKYKKEMQRNMSKMLNKSWKILYANGEELNFNFQMLKTKKTFYQLGTLFFFNADYHYYLYVDRFKKRPNVPDPKLIGKESGSRPAESEAQISVIPRASSAGTVR